MGPGTDLQPVHQPVLLDEVLTWLDPRPGGCYCDATVGLGGHARAILERSGPDGRLIGLDRDVDALASAGEALRPFGDRVALVHAPFSRLREVLDGLGVIPLGGVNGLLVDLGVSSPQLDRPERGFSFRASGPLDMRMDQTQGETVGDLLSRVGEDELARIIRDYGEERYAARVARAIVAAREAGELGSTDALAALVARAMPRHERHKNPATRTFQALRMAVNRELEELEAFLAQAPACLKPGGRLCVIAFHSLEDRMVKRRLRALAARDVRGPGEGQGESETDAGGDVRLRILTKHVVVAGEDERLRNPRARSAKLRAAERI
jgi:16S rRNA (cytosine1402-N4)-methyltransferase